MESSYNAPIMALLTSFGCRARDMSGERGGQTGENIDIKLWHEDQDTAAAEPFAGIEVKKVGGIDTRAKGQIKTEANRFGNAILTDNLRWEFWRAGEEKMTAGVQLIERNGDTLKLCAENADLFASLIRDFLLQNPAQIRSSGKLAEYMAMHARTVRDVVAGILKEDEFGSPQTDERQRRLPMFQELYGLYEKIREELLPALHTRDFADMYAQTVVYGLFIARYNDATPDSFDRYEAIGNLQRESALLSRFFTHIAGTGPLHPTLESVVDKLCALYRSCDIAALLERGEARDPIVHFYEEFLSFYDPALRKSLGVFYTPPPVVRYLVSAVDQILAEGFQIPGGLSNNDRVTVTVPAEQHAVSKKGVPTRYIDTEEVSVPRVAILDPAVGTGSFHAEIVRYIKDTYFSGPREAFYSGWIQDENGLLSRLAGFEIMMTSYAVAHLKVRRMIQETLGRPPEAALPGNIFLTNTLAPPRAGLERSDQVSFFMDFSAAISEEAYQADTWKTRRPVRVVIGNPPYLAASTNAYDISAYKTETDGVTDFGERKHWLNDDYVKFFRFSQQILEKNEEGVLAFVSNNGYLDNPTFRGMRASLLRTFDEISIVNLHGSANKKETAPGGGKDENIFDIRQGVALFIGIRKSTDTAWGKVRYADLWGTREHKFTCLDHPDFKFTELTIDPKMAYFVPFANDEQEASEKATYERGVSLTELFPVNVTGIVSGNDETAIAPTREELARRLKAVRYAVDDEQIRIMWGKFGRGQTAEKIRDDVLSPEGVITPIAYRPFDNRWTYYTGSSCGWVFWPREKKAMGQFMIGSETPVGKNIGMVFCKGDSTLQKFSMMFISDTMIDNRLTVAQTAGIASIAPLYLHNDMDGWTPNLAPAALERLTRHMGFSPTPVEVFDYVYGILYDPAYRERYNEFLKRDYPRVPVVGAEGEGGFPVDEGMFRAYAEAGARLRALHLLRERVPAALSLDPAAPDHLEIRSVKYQDGILHLSADTRILGIAPEVWGYTIGGYQVLSKWLKSHKGEALTAEKFDHLANVAGLLAETIQIQRRLREMHGS